MIRLLKIILIIFTSYSLYAQTTIDRLEEVQKHYYETIQIKDSLENIIEVLKLERIIERIHKNGLPELEDGEELVCHSAMCLVFSEEYRLAKWVVHILTGDIIEGRVSRSNDFRPDPKIPNAGEEADYFLKIEQEDGSFKYDGFGYDRGHLAPSADFRWSENALSESYYYSNITPQAPDFNRKKWAEIEGFLRTYIYENPGNDLFIVTAPMLKEGLPVQERGVNQLPIPEIHYKIAVDFNRKIGVAFIVPQENLNYPIDWYAVTIDSVENLTGINFFAGLNQEDEELIESTYDLSLWYPDKQKSDVRPLTREELPPNTYNTIEARQMIDYHRDVTVCGTVVSTHKSGKGNIFLNLDKSFPNQIFSVTVWARDVVNFDYQPEIFLKGKKVCFIGKVKDYQGTPSLYISNSKDIFIIE
jgi:endonuclease G, mitochondrial